MKRFVFTVIFLLQLVSPLKATPNKQDSLRVFLEQIGEDTTMISFIVNSPDAKEPSRIINNYRSLLRLGYDCNREQYEWYPGWEDSLYVCKYVDYLTQQIIQDTMLYLIKDYLEEVYLFLFQDEYAVGRLLNCAEYAIEKYHSRSGYLLPELYYYNKKESIADWQGKLQYFEMIKFILLQKKLVCYFDEDVNKKLNNIVAESNETSPYYSQFKAYLNSLSDLELARITEEQTATIVKTLLVGVAEGEKMSQMTYAFMLLTGQFIEKDEVLGHQILNDLLEKEI